MTINESKHPETDFDKIVFDCQKGERYAQKALYDAFAPVMYAVCLRYTHNQVDAEDLLHDGFIKVFTKIGQYKKTGSLEGWIRRIIVNTILEEFRKRKKDDFVNDDKFFNNKPDEPDEYDEDTHSDINQIIDLVKKLPDKYRMVFNLFVVEGYSHDMIADELNISVGTSKSNLSRARQWLKTRLGTIVTNKHETLW